MRVINVSDYVGRWMVVGGSGKSEAAAEIGESGILRATKLPPAKSDRAEDEHNYTT
jgi:hypothetical protein